MTTIFCENLGLYKKKCFNSNVVNIVLFVRYFLLAEILIYNHIFTATCPQISLDNGSVVYFAPLVNGQYLPGTVVVFTCDPGFVRNGPLAGECQASGTWLPEIPTCEGTPNILHSNLTLLLIYLKKKYIKCEMLETV